MFGSVGRRAVSLGSVISLPIQYRTGADTGGRQQGWEANAAVWRRG